MNDVKQEKLKTEILEAFDSLKFKPRGNQVEIIYSVLDAFLNKGKKSVVLNAGTGVGKSVIGAVIATVIGSKTDDLASIMLTGTNILAKQYHESFEDLDPYRFFQIKGASNYPCHFMEAQPMPPSKTAEECVGKKLHPAEYDKYCTRCEFNSSKKKVNIAENLITNYSYFFISKLASGHLKDRQLHIFDEAHLMNDLFCSYTEIKITTDLLDRYIKELQDTNGKCVNEAAGLVLVKQRLLDKDIGESNYMSILEILRDLYKSCRRILNSQATELEKVDILASAKFDKMARKYDNLYTKINDLFMNEYDHVFDDSTPNTVVVKTIFVSEMIQSLLTKYNLFMSATITENFAFETLGLDKNETEFIQTPVVFPPENKPLFFIGNHNLNYTAMKDPEIIDELKKQVKTIVDFHKSDKGLIIVPSFYLGSQMVYGLRGSTVYEHRSGTNLPDLVEKFKSHKGPAVLVSPSIFEGLDFSDDDSRFQIIVKSPFPSLGDKRIKYIADNYPTIYQEMTLLKILQGIGRSIRSPTDSAATYFLDNSSKKLYNSKLNLWKDHYTVMTK